MKSVLNKIDGCLKSLQETKEMTIISGIKNRIRLYVLYSVLFFGVLCMIFTGQCADMISLGSKSDNNTNRMTGASYTKVVAAAADIMLSSQSDDDGLRQVTVGDNVMAPAQQADPVTVTSKSYKDDTFTVYDQNSHKTVTLNGFEMVCRIVRNEVGASYHSGAMAGQTVFDKETIKAHAVAAYSYLKYSQVRGVKASVGLKSDISDTMRSYVSEVDGLAMYYNGQYICAAYTASTGGSTLSSRYCWGSSTPYLAGVESKYDSKSPQYAESKVMSAQQVRTIIERNTDIRLSDNPANWFYIAGTVDGNYVSKLIIDGNSQCTIRGRKTAITGWTFREQIFGYQNIKSPAFTVSYADGNFTFTSYGHGHGVGMPAEGAQLYATIDHWNYAQILKHYYTGVEIK